MILSKLSQRLVFSGLAILLLVLMLFSISVYAFVQQRSYEQAKAEISIIVDSAISSIDFDETGRNDAGVPDILSSVIPEESADALRPLRLQWFSAQGVLSNQKGNLAVDVPFDSAAGYQFQKSPHAILLTKAARARGKLLGYVRVAKPLEQIDVQMKDLCIGLVFGTLVALAVSALGGWWLLRLALRPTEQMIARLGQFVADASHELRSPLMVIQTNCDAALRALEDKSGKQGTKLIAIKSATDQMIGLTKDLLSLTDVEQRIGDKQLVNLSALITPFLSSIKSRSENKDIDLVVELPDALQVLGSPEDMQRLYFNVIENAFRYTKAPGKVHICGEKVNKSISLIVEDTGIGIASQDLPKVFDRFWRADQARNYRDNGNGLGLAIAASIAKAYGGSITVTSELGVGSKFVITLPAATPPVSAPEQTLAAGDH